MDTTANSAAFNNSVRVLLVVVSYVCYFLIPQSTSTTEPSVSIREIQPLWFSSHRTHLALLGLDDCVLLRGNYGDDSLTDRHGCPAYVGPELLTSGNQSYSGRAADIWSLGVSLYTMLIGRYPFQDTQPSALFSKIRRGTYSLPDWLSPQAKCLIGCMLRKSPADRLEASELLSHPWLTNPSTPHHTTNKTNHSSQVIPQNKHEDGDQVVPTWTDKH